MSGKTRLIVFIIIVFTLVSAGIIITSISLNNALADYEIKVKEYLSSYNIDDATIIVERGSGRYAGEKIYRLKVFSDTFVELDTSDKEKLL